MMSARDSGDPRSVRAALCPLVATALLECGGLRIATDEPFTLASGNRSPIYIDCRSLINRADHRLAVTACARMLIAHLGIHPDCVAGGETAGIPFGAWLADAMGTEFVYVRKATKEHGTRSLVEGGSVSGKQVLLFEDLVTDGRSKEGFITSLRDAGARIEHCLVIVDRVQGGEARLDSYGVRLHSLVTLSEVLKYAGERGHISPDDLLSIDHYLCDPKQWSSDRGFPHA